jgi:sugar phosphate isomerase/epimerase
VRLAISNLAWVGRDGPPYEEYAAGLGVVGLEVAPTTLLGPNPASAPAAERAAVRERLAATGLSITGVQSLYFGHPELQLLATGADQRAFVEQTCRIADVCADLGGTTMVFGAPGNRRRDGLPVTEAVQRAAETLHEVGSYCTTRGVVLVPEPCPRSSAATSSTPSPRPPTSSAGPRARGSACTWTPVPRRRPKPTGST